MKSKKACEEAVTHSSEKDFADGWTIVRPSTFLSNFLAPGSRFMYPELESKQVITTALRPDFVTSVLDHGDVGGLAADMLTCDFKEWNKKWKGKFIPLAKENLTTSETVGKMNAALKKAGSKKEIRLVQLGEAEAKQRAAHGDMVVASQIFQNEYMTTWDLKEVVRSGVDVEKMVNADVFFEREKSKLLETVGAA